MIRYSFITREDFSSLKADQGTDLLRAFKVPITLLSHTMKDLNGYSGARSGVTDSKHGISDYSKLGKIFITLASVSIGRSY